MMTVDFAKRLGTFELAVAFEAGNGVTALFGKSGSGKSSIIKAIAGLLRPDRGQISLGADVLFDAARGLNVRVERRRTGVVFQDGRLFPHLSVEQNLLYGWSRAPAVERKITLQSVVDVLGIEALLKRKPASLSGGERQRVAIGRALLAQPRVLLMDEPLASLDAARKEEVLPYLADINTTFAIPIVYVTHDAGEVLRLANAVVLLANGSITAQGALADVTSRLDLPAEAEALGLGAILEGTIETNDAGRGLTTVSTAVGPFKLPLQNQPTGSRIAIRVPARDVAIALEQPGAISVQNMFAAIVGEMVPAGPHTVRLALRAGTGRIVAEVTADAVRRLGLESGKNVIALVKSVALAR